MVSSLVGMGNTQADWSAATMPVTKISITHSIEVARSKEVAKVYIIRLEYNYIVIRSIAYL